MQNILAIDPGRDTGWAIIEGGELKACGLGTPPAPDGRHVVIERPQVYRGRSSPGDPNDLITLAIQVGRYTERATTEGAATVEHVLPHNWKGSMDADICCHRVANALDEKERALLYSVLAPLARKPMTVEFLTSGKRHNVIDAVGLGIWSVGSRLAGRFTRVR